MVDLLPSGWQVPQIACVRVIIVDKENRSERYVQNNWIPTPRIVAKKEKVGSAEVTYAEMRPECFQGPFLEEEVFLYKMDHIVSHHADQDHSGATHLNSDEIAIGIRLACGMAVYDRMVVKEIIEGTPVAQNF